MERVLAFEQAPSLTGPLRFFLSAPLFAFAAAILLLWQGPEALASRWSPATLALTHLLTLGFLASSMIGALIQILPVVAGVSIPKTHTTAVGVHLLLVSGTALLVAAFWHTQPGLFKLALICLGTAFVWLLLACAIGLWQARRPASSATVNTITMALAALTVTVILGATLASAFAWPLPLSLPLLLLTDLHAAWGLLGWVGLLVIGVAFQVVPMFQVTSVYPGHITRWLAASLLGLLLLWSIAAIVFQRSHWSTTILAALVLSGYLVFALTTLHLLWHRKRPKPDATTWFWRASMGSLLASGAIWLLQQSGNYPQLSLTLGMLFIVGFGYSVINGMLYKIVPFLVWYHLQHSMRKGQRAPSVRDVIPDSIAVRQFAAHLIALLLLVGATLWPAGLTHAAALALAVSSGWLWLNLFQATRLYLRVKRNAESSLVVA
jgi:hypothetical protein